MLICLAIAACLPVAPTDAHAGQVSVEDASRAAGLPIQTGFATVNGVEIYYRDIGARSEPVLLLHGFPETGDVFAGVVATLGRKHRLIVPDMRGAGLSQRPATGYEKRIQAADLKALLDRLNIDRVHLVGHDIGARVAFAFALQYLDRVSSLTVAEAFIEGLSGSTVMKWLGPLSARTRHFARFARVDEAVAEYRGKEDLLVLGFMNSRSQSRKFVADDVARYTEALRRGGGLRAAFMNYESIERDAAFTSAADTGKLSAIPALALTCAGQGGNTLLRQLRLAGLTDVKGVTLEHCAHWIYEENPGETLPVIARFLDSRPRATRSPAAHEAAH